VKRTQQPQQQQPARPGTTSPGVGREEPWVTDETRDLARAVVALETDEEALRFLRDLCTVTELREFGERWHVARLLDQGMSYAEIGRLTGASSATISRVGQWLRYGRDGYRLVIDRLAGQEASR
jgi:TrpR-related protein YerC/YecD